jgi:hypothetical protein
VEWLRSVLENKKRVAPIICLVEGMRAELFHSIKHHCLAPLSQAVLL